MGRIVVGIDGSRESRAALDEAIREAEWRNAAVEAVMVIIVPAAATLDLGTVDIERLRAFGDEVSERELEAARERYDGTFPVPVEHRARVGHPGSELIRAAGGDGSDEEPAELLVLGSRGLGGFKGLLLGSVTSYVSHHPPCPLLIVRPTADDVYAEQAQDEAE